MRILITGGCGFIGSHIAELLEAKGNTLFVITRQTENYRRISRKKDRVFLEGNLRDRAFLDKAFRDARPEAVIHTAWDGVTGHARNERSQINNLLMTAHLLEMTIHHGVASFIGVGSQAEYGVHNVRIDEGFTPRPDTLYGVYKLAAGLSGYCMASTHGFNYAWLRLFSTFGPGDDDYYIIPYTIQSFLSGESPRLTECLQQWDYLYVRDVAALVEKVIESKDSFRGIFNLCSSRPLMLKDIIITIKESISSSIEPSWGAVPVREGGLFHLEGDNQKFRDEFGWIALTDLADGLRETIEWHRLRSMQKAE